MPHFMRRCSYRKCPIFYLMMGFLWSSIGKKLRVSSIKNSSLIMPLFGNANDLFMLIAPSTYLIYVFYALFFANLFEQ